MGERARLRLLPWVVALVVIGVLAAVLGGVWAGGEQAPPEPPAHARVEPPAPAPSPPPAGPLAAPSASVNQALPEPEPVPGAEPGTPERPQPVDLEHLRQRLPDNLYWREWVPTREPEELRRRAEEKQRRSALYGRIQANEASEEEIRGYYEHRRQASEDAIAFASLVLQEYGSKLSEEEQGLYALSIRMHRTRLEDLPQQLEQALARKQAQDRRREQWLRNGGKQVE